MALKGSYSDLRFKLFANRPEQLGEPFVTGTAEIGLGFLMVDEPLLGFLHHLQDWRIAFAIAEYADADIDLVGARIGVSQRDQREQ